MDATVFENGPDTPAHVFAARAFRNRLWGTPKPMDTVIKPRNIDSGTSRPAEIQSPSKPNGILLTPGTANMRRAKTVSFPLESRSDEVKKPSNAHDKLSAVVPGKFPTPSRLDVTALDHVSDPAKLTTLTEKLFKAKMEKPVVQAHAEPEKRAVQLAPQVNKSSEEDWQALYNQYAARTEREMKKLIAKRQSAKRFAQEKNSQASRLSVQLHNEQRKVERLELQVNDLQRQLAELSVQLQADRPKSAGDRNLVPSTVPDQHNATETRARSKSRRPVASESDDLWAGAFASSPAPPTKGVAAIKAGKTLTGSATSDNPLRPIDVNVLPSRSSPKRSSPQHQQQQRTKRLSPRPTVPTVRQQNVNSPSGGGVAARYFSDDESLLRLPQPSPDLPRTKISATAATVGKDLNGTRLTPDEAVMESSAFVSTPSPRRRSVRAERRGTEQASAVDAAAQRKGHGSTLGGNRRGAVGTEVGGESPRKLKMLDEERRAQAAARIAARRRMREGAHTAAD